MNHNLDHPRRRVIPGVDNLLLNCMHVQPGDRVLLILEAPEENLYCQSASNCIEQRMLELGATVSTLRPGLISDPSEFPESVSEAMQQADHSLFLSRIGDYCRFVPFADQGTKTLCYAQNVGMLTSPYASTDYELTTQLQRKLETEFLQADNWHITCDLGTDIRGTFDWPSLRGSVDDDFSLALFPMTTFKPVPCHTASGTVALSRWLIPGAAAKTVPSTLEFDGIVMAQVEDGELVQLDGFEQAVAQISEFYDFVSTSLNVNRNRVHSWHAGINPATCYHDPAENNLERWGAVSFGSPRYLHFHTCGDMPPGEIAWSVFNPTVTIDGEIYWQNGQLIWMQRPDNRELIDQFVGGETLLAESADIGV